jgi:hypothetical protein
MEGHDQGRPKLTAQFLLKLVLSSLLGCGILQALAAGLAVWSGLSTLVVAPKFDDFPAGIILYAGCAAFGYWRLGRIVPGRADRMSVRAAGPLLIAAAVRLSFVPLGLGLAFQRRLSHDNVMAPRMKRNPAGGESCRSLLVRYVNKFSGL